MISGVHSGVVYAHDDSTLVNVSGDFRYRFEVIDKEGASETRRRHRIRARFGVHAELTDDSRVVIQLASGSDDLVCRQAFWTALSLKLSQTMT